MGLSLSGKDNAARFVVAIAGAAALFGITMLSLPAQETAGATRTDNADEKRWQAVAPGRIEPVSGEIRIAAPIAGLMTQVLVKTGDKVSADEPLIRLSDQEARARVDSANAQVAVRKRARNDQAPSSRAADRRKAEDAVADDEQAIVSARAEFDRVALERRAGRTFDSELEAARSVLARARERLKQHKTDLRNTDMTEALLPGADLSEAQASGVEFFRCDMSSVNFQEAHLRNANFRDANVDGAKFSGADMGITILRETNLSKADLSGVDLSTTLLPPGYGAKKQEA